MALVVDPYTATPGATIAAAEINARIAAIIAQVNGNLDAANVKDASITKAKLASDALAAFLKTVGSDLTIRSFSAAVAASGGGWQTLSFPFGFSMASVAMVLGAPAPATNGSALTAWNLGSFNGTSVALNVNNVLAQNVTFQGVVIGTP